MLSIGNFTLDSPLVLAPMSGISDLPYRLINRRFGCGFAFTEMISAIALTYGSRNTLKMLRTVPEDRPLGLQLLGADPDIVRKALDIASKYPFDLIDLNAACPVSKVVSGGKGAALLREPGKLHTILKTIVAHTSLPVTVKIRAGWDDTSVNAVEVALRARDAGVKGLFIHGRTKMQAYRGNVDYSIIRRVKEAIDIPVIASGDAMTPPLVKRLFEETGCDGVALARGALGNPWIFRDCADHLGTGAYGPSRDVREVARAMREHLSLNITHSNELFGVIRFRKFFAWYTKGLSVRELKARAFHAETEADMLRLIDELETGAVTESAHTEAVNSAAG